MASFGNGAPHAFIMPPDNEDAAAAAASAGRRRNQASSGRPLTRLGATSLLERRRRRRRRRRCRVDLQSEFGWQPGACVTPPGARQRNRKFTRRRPIVLNGELAGDRSSASGKLAVVVEANSANESSLVWPREHLQACQAGLPGRSLSSSSLSSSSRAPAKSGQARTSFSYEAN